MNANGPDRIKHKQCSQSHGSIKLGAPEMLQDVNNDEVCWTTRRETGDSHHCWNLPYSNVQGRACHESGNRREGDEVDQPTKSRYSKKTYYGASYDCQRTSDIFGSPTTWIICHDLNNDVACNSRQHSDRLNRFSSIPTKSMAIGTYPNSDVFGSRKEPINQDTHERRIKTELYRQFC